MNWSPTSPNSDSTPHSNGLGNAIVLLSGGLDSSVALAEILQTRKVCLALTFDYGQRALIREMEAARVVARHFEVPHQIVDLPWLARMLPKALTPKDQLSTSEAPVTEANLFETARVWVPNRNGLFLNIAAAHAEVLGADVVVFGANADEAIGFPDNTPEFRDSQTHTFSYSTLRKVRVETPVGHLTKAEIIRRGVELGLPLRAIWSCYEGEAIQCGVCPSCRLLKKALAEAKPETELEFTT